MNHLSPVAIATTAAPFAGAQKLNGEGKKKVPAGVHVAHPPA